ncbi:Methyl-accepting chemotaxis protein [Winogradskyella psychrotolerans RS-3]|uniref:Methyl-accepting chemotaxis protein n=1 Tax=Winogradskyella psychrotolerans RS-3 TaxID=641526 RepID=S7VT61_9FLAO|nr:DUF4391 domain-containing protein [Winogradskyella psychrotolerans]EPR73440.1 Methyl-accepting chemotaxis protein [Winogradskyella psychrotolerans RS-3]
MGFKYNNILNIPERNILDKKLTKAFFLKNFILSAAEKNVLNNSIQQMNWLASIKPITANILAVNNDDYKYEEIQIMVCTIADNTLDVFAEKCMQLFQKYIPYQMLVIIEDVNGFKISACDKRINKVEPSKRTIERYFVTDTLSKLYKNDLSDAFYKALDFGNLDKTNLELLYKSYIQAVVQFQAASITGSFQKRTNARNQEDMKHLEAIEQLERDIISLTSQIKKETQLNKKVHLNILIKKNRDRIDELKQMLTAKS